MLIEKTAIVSEADEDRNPSTAQFFAPLVKKHGGKALRLVLAGIGGRLPRSNLGFLADLLLAFARRLPNETREWLKELMAEASWLRNNLKAFLTSICIFSLTSPLSE